MAEMAIVLPVLLLLLLGIVQLGITFNNNVALTDAVRAGARTAAVSRHVSDPDTVTKNRVRESAASLDTSKLTIVVKADPSWETGAKVTVTASYPYDINLLGMVVKSGNLSSSTVERVE
jgi:Flp pilus assembly protein TadG